MLRLRGAGRPRVRSLVLVNGIALSLAASFVSIPGAAASAPSDCVLWDPVDLRVEVTEASDLNDLGTDNDCNGLTVFQVNDVDLDGWVGPSGHWFGTFDGNGFEFVDTQSDEEASLFDQPAGQLVIVDVVRHGNVVGSDKTGGLVGESIPEVVISNSHTTGNVTTANDGAGGLIGRAAGSLTITNSSSAGNISGLSYVGGLVGDTDGVVNIEDSHSSGDVQGVDFVAGLVGDTDAVITIERSYSTGSVEGTDDSVGGLVGYGMGVIISDSYTTGDVSALFYVGGAVGEVGPLGASISRSFASGNINSREGLGGLSDSSGGLVGDAIGEVSITQSYASGDIAGSDDTVGGLVGNGNVRDVTITESFFIGNAFGGDPTVGGLIGDIGLGDLVISNSFCLAGAVGCSANSAAADDLRSRNYLEDLNGWDFDSVWCVRSSLNHGFPVLRTINFGPGDTNNCRSRHGRPTRQVTLDPAGGSCGEHSSAWTIEFRGTYQLPTATDCVRPGYVLLGWTRDASRTSDQDLLTTSVSRSGSLTAVWGALPPASGSIAILANAWCIRCSSALVIWSSVSGSGLSAEVSVDGTAVECAESGNVEGFEFCWISGLESGSSHSVSVAWRNEYGVGPAGTTSFSLN